MKILLDTSVLIAALRRGKQGLSYFKTFEKEGDELYVSAMTIFEIFSGTSSRMEKEQLLIRKISDFFIVVDVTWEIGQKAGEIYRDMKVKLGVADFIIAATALGIGAQIVTLNTRHFKQIPGVKLYKHA